MLLYCLFALAASLHLLFSEAWLCDSRPVLFVGALKILIWAYHHGFNTVIYAAVVFVLLACLAYVGHELFKLIPASGQPQSLKTSNPLRPLIFPCRTAHTRLFPQKHSFSYSYLLVGVPVGWRGSVAGMLSVDGSVNKEIKAWFSVNAENYLHRGHGDDGLDGKLSLYLKSQVCSSDDRFRLLSLT